VRDDLGQRRRKDSQWGEEDYKIRSTEIRQERERNELAIGERKGEEMLRIRKKQNN